jgi:four helix bundle protein
MSKIEKLEDLLVWQSSKELAATVYKLTRTFNSSDFGLTDQIRRAAISIPSNIAEGFGRGGNKEFLQYLSISKGSLYELKTQLLIAHEIGYINLENSNSIQLQIEKIAKMISGLISYLKSSELKGNKYNYKEQPI